MYETVADNADHTIGTNVFCSIGNGDYRKDAASVFELLSTQREAVGRLSVSWP